LLRACSLPGEPTFDTRAVIQQGTTTETVFLAPAVRWWEAAPLSQRLQEDRIDGSAWVSWDPEWSYVLPAGSGDALRSPEG